MRHPKYASSKVRLARELNIGRNKMHQLTQEIDFPVRSANGMWDVAAVRRWMKQHKANGNGSDRELLQGELLRVKLERERYQLAESRKATREEIRAEFASVFLSAMQTIRGSLDRMSGQLAPQFEGRTAREIRHIWRERQRQTFNEIAAAFNKRTGATVKVEDTASNLVQFAAAGS